MTSRNEFDKQIQPYNKIGKQIWVMPYIKTIPKEIVKVAINLLQLDFINFLEISNTTLAASSHNENIRLKTPITAIGHPTASGIKISYNANFKAINFLSINTPIKGNGTKMVEAILKELPIDWQLSVDKDWSGGFWTKMKAKHSTFNW